MASDQLSARAGRVEWVNVYSEANRRCCMLVRKDGQAFVVDGRPLKKCAFRQADLFSAERKVCVCGEWRASLDDDLGDVRADRAGVGAVGETHAAMLTLEMEQREKQKRKQSEGAKAQTSQHAPIGTSELRMLSPIASLCHHLPSLTQSALHEFRMIQARSCVVGSVTSPSITTAWSTLSYDDEQPSELVITPPL